MDLEKQQHAWGIQGQAWVVPKCKGSDAEGHGDKEKEIPVVTPELMKKKKTAEKNYSDPLPTAAPTPHYSLHALKPKL